MNTLTNKSGFTLIELIMVMVLLSIVGIVGANFLSRAFKGFSDTDIRMEIYEEGKAALVRMERELHMAIPNAFDQVSNTELQFGMIDEVVMRDVFGMYDESPPTTTLTDLFVLPPTSDTTKFLPVNTIVSIYNRNWNDFTAPPYRLYNVDSVALGVMTISSNVTPPRSSPLKRYYAVDSAVRYQLAGSTLYRAVAPVTTTGVGVFGTNYPLATNVSQSGGLPIFDYTPASLTQNGVVSIRFTIRHEGANVNFHKEVHIKNVP